MKNTVADCSSVLKTNRTFPVLFAQPAELIGHELGLQLNTNCAIATSMKRSLKSGNISTATFYTEQDELGFRLLLPIFSKGED